MQIHDSRTPTLPTLSEGVTLLETEGREIGPLHSLVLDQLLLGEGEAVWIDARGNAVTTNLARMAPSMRVLDRIAVARGFTAFQHYSLVEDASELVDEETELFVLPAVEWMYEDDDLPRSNGEEMLTAALAEVQNVVDESGCRALLTRHAATGLGSSVESFVDQTLECETTAYGPRFSGEDFETLVYGVDGDYVQTTLAFWRRVLVSRHQSIGSEDSPEVSQIGAY